MVFLYYFFLLTAIIAFCIFVFRILDKYNCYGVKILKNNSNLIIVSILLLSLSSLLLCFILYYTNKLIEFPEAFDKDYSKIGLFGDMLGGILNPVVAFIGIIAASLAFYVQYVANKKIQEQFKTQQITEHFYLMLEIHIKNVDNFKIDSYRIERDDQNFQVSKPNDTTIHKSFTSAFNHIMATIPSSVELIGKDPQLINDEIKEYTISASYKKTQLKITEGNKTFILMIKDFHLCQYLVFQANEFFKYNLETKQCNELAYKFFFWGTNSNHVYDKEIDKLIITNINNYLSIARKLFRTNKGAKYTFSYNTHEEERENVLRFIPISGHSSRLAHYFRHLYQTVKFIHYSFKEGQISKLELDNNLKTLRAQFSNEEVLLLYYNYIVGFGPNWDQKGEHNYPFFRDYGLLHNIPLYDNIPIEIDHPLTHFKDYIEKQREKNPKFRMFEWEKNED